jgi:hypothetical protein
MWMTERHSTLNEDDSESRSTNSSGKRRQAAAFAAEEWNENTP